MNIRLHHITPNNKISRGYSQFFYPVGQVRRHFCEAALGAVDDGPEAVAVDWAGGRGCRKEEGEQDQRRRQPKQA